MKNDDDIFEEPLIFVASNIELLPTESLVEHATNAKKHPPEQIAKLAGGIREFGFTVPVLVDKARKLIAGHGRVLAGRALGMKFIPAIFVGHLSPAQVRALILFDNRISETGFDAELLRVEIEGLAELDASLLGLTGFDCNELDAILAGIKEDGADTEEENVAEVPKLKFGGHSIELTTAEASTLDQLAEQHVARFGSYHGFVEKTLLPYRPQ